MVQAHSTRRTFLLGSLATGAILGLDACSDKGNSDATPSMVSNRQAEPSAWNPSKVVSITEHGGKTSSADNSAALGQALAAAGANGQVTIPAGQFTFTQPVSWPAHRVAIKGEGSASEPTHLLFHGPSVGLSASASGWNGSRIENLTLSGATSAQLYIDGAAGQQFVVKSCTFEDSPLFSIQVQGSNLYVTDSQFHGRADGTGTAVQASKSTTKVTAKNCSITGCFRGLYCAGISDLTAQQMTVNPMWWCGNPTKYAATLTAATATGFTIRQAIAQPTGTPKFTVTAWEKLTRTGSLSGSGEWWNISGISQVEPRLMVRTKDAWGIVLETQGGRARIPYWYSWANCHPVAAPSGSATVTVEKPYIAALGNLSGTTGTVDMWRAGAKAANTPPPAGARLQITPAPDYHLFATQGVSSMSVSDSLVMNSWSDSISSIQSSNTQVTGNRIYDSQDVGITLQQGKGGCVAKNNTITRAGTAGIFIGTSHAIISGNTVNGGQHMANKEDSYAPLQIEGAEGVTVKDNTVNYGGAPFEVRGMIIEGRYGPFPQTAPTKGPFAKNGTYSGNKFNGYPDKLSIPVPSSEPSLKVVDVTIRGRNASAKSASWPSGTRFQGLDGASPSQVKGK